ncbi:hypothetical protein [Aquisphaera insulae]|uniref:hypothetical protein n=1 Tax=Aquisphaera insulae TaxID=2712864 RepID=UPI0013ED79DF|nr:hypothetical protein [Aquisphaera insulae]
MSSDDPVDFRRFQAAEAEEIVDRRQARGGAGFEPASRVTGEDSILETTGLSLSGGGIRSACFNLGLLEGLDRVAHEPPGKPMHPARDASLDRSCLECFDYVSSVSGGSYVAGHFAMSMMPARPWDEGDRAAWLGRVDLSSKTVPGWLWGIGAWFLGVAFQLLKTGALIVGLLATIAFVLRILDAPTSNRFWYVVGLRTDLTRGFVPFWISLVIFLTGYGFHTSSLLKHRRGLWFVYTALAVIGYVAAVWMCYEEVPDENRHALPFWFQYAFLIALFVPILVFCLRVLASRVVRSLRAIGPPRSGVGGESATASLEESEHSKGLQNVLLVPMLVALFCFAGLVATNDIKFDSYGDTPEELQGLLEKGQRYGHLGDQLYRVAVAALGLISAVFLFPRKLFQSARAIEGHECKQGESFLRRWGLEPVFRVVIFLCSYGFILLLIFVLYSTVARENVSGYYEWRDSLPAAALHPSEFRNWERAWDQIALDAQDPGAPGWGEFAAALMSARDATARPMVEDGAAGPGADSSWLEDEHQVPFPLHREKAETAEIRILDSMPWIVRLAPYLMRLGPETPWRRNGIDPSRAPSRLYDLLSHADQVQLAISRGVSDRVLNRPNLYTKLESVEGPAPIDIDRQREFTPEMLLAWKAGLEAYRVNARRLAGAIEGASEGRRTILAAAVRNNNREALRLYLPNLILDRHAKEKQIFAWAVWSEDQWTRARVAAIALALWVLCCAVDPNTFGLQKFYRRHVVDGWIKTPRMRRDESCYWLHAAGRTYRGHEFGAGGASRDGSQERRAPILLINATLEGNRSLGDEPSLTEDIFTFSPLGAGSGETGYWLNGDAPATSFTRRNNLDLGNMVATSGAFLSPGTMANPALSAILHLLNIQTGYWVHDPGRYRRRSLWESLRFHVGQSLGIDCGGDSRYMLTDGAHVENLGLYALLQRRCSLIVASDCSQGERTESAEHRFDALVQVLQQAGVHGIEFGPFLNSNGYRHWLQRKQLAARGGREGCDRGGAIGLDLVRPVNRSKGRKRISSDPGTCPPSNGDGASARNLAFGLGSDASGRQEAAGKDQSQSAHPFAQEHYLFSRIFYPDGTEGLLVYLRPTLTGDEGDGLLHAAADSTFPDDDPLDQFYAPAKMNTYRLLGRHIATELMHDPVMRTSLHDLTRGEAAPSGWSTDPDSAGDCCDIGCAIECEWRRQSRFRSGSSARDPQAAGQATDVAKPRQSAC